MVATGGKLLLPLRYKLISVRSKFGYRSDIILLNFYGIYSEP